MIHPLGHVFSAQKLYFDVNKNLISVHTVQLSADNLDLIFLEFFSLKVYFLF